MQSLAYPSVNTYPRSGNPEIIMYSFSNLSSFDKSVFACSLFLNNNNNNNEHVVQEPEVRGATKHNH